jgi:hypothetical protein
MSERYAFKELPIEPITPGTTLLVAGPTHAGTANLWMRLLARPSDEGAIFVTTNKRAARLATDCDRLGVGLSLDTTGVVDCVGQDDDSTRAHVVPVSGPADLTGIGMRYSDLYRKLAAGGVDRVRTGLYSMSTLLSFGELRPVSRFVHTLTGRIDSVGGLGVLLIDPAAHDERTIRTVAQFCDGRLDVREGDAGPELRARGYPGAEGTWTPFETTPEP